MRRLLTLCSDHAEPGVYEISGNNEGLQGYVMSLAQSRDKSELTKMKARMLNMLEDAHQVDERRTCRMAVYLVKTPRKRSSEIELCVYHLRRTSVNSVYDQCIEHGVRPGSASARGSDVYIIGAPFRACTGAMKHEDKGAG